MSALVKLLKSAVRAITRADAVDQKMTVTPIGTVVPAHAGTQVDLAFANFTRNLIAFALALALAMGLALFANPTHAQIPQAITGTAPASPITYAPGLTFTLNFTGGGSGNPVVFATSTPTMCSVSGNVVTVLQANDVCTLTANQAGNATYSAAPELTGYVVINKAPQVVTFPQPPTPGTYAPNLTFTVSATGGASGNPVVFASQTPTLCSVGGAGGNVVSVLAGGWCGIAASQAGNTNYAAAVTPVNYIVINQADQVITASSPPTPITYQPPPNNTFTLSATGGASGNPIVYGTSTPNICTVVGNVVSVLRAGLCTSNASQAGNAQYNAAIAVGFDVRVDKAAQTITFAALANKALSDPAFTVSATTSSGLAITFTSRTATKCTVSGNTVTLVATGTCTIRAAQSGNNSYLAASNVDQSFTITAGSTTPQAITGFSPVTPITYVPAPQAGNTFTLSASGGGSGNPVVFASTTAGVCTTGGTNGSTVTIQTAGTCTLTANQAGNSAYTAAPQVTVNVIINKASQTITFAVLTDKALSDPAFTLAATASSGLAVAFTSTTTAVCTVAGNTVTLVSAGTCTIAANQGGDGNYLAATTVSRSFQVTDVPKVYFIHADHLGTPRVITRPSDNQVVWRWDNTDPFGANLPNEDPSATGTAFKFNLRFPGQYYDAETATHYNYYRDYDPATGRYSQSDPIGLNGGISTYAYVDGNPLSKTDRRGLSFDKEFPDPLLPPVDEGYTCVKNVSNDVFARARREGWVRFDKRLHCVVSCEAAKKCGRPAAAAGGVGRELMQLYIQGDILRKDRRKDSADDQRANDFGLNCPPKENCDTYCKQRY